MTDSKAAPEPSMEEILSSIRRIIAEDEAAPPPTAASTATAGQDEEDDVLELTEMVGDADGPAAGAPRATAEPAALPPPVLPAVQEKPAMSIQTSEPLISSNAAAASTNAFARLAKAAAPEEKRSASAQGITVDQLVVDLLTPMLRDWLDQNLPGIVERVVEQEVKKLARRAELT